MWFGTANGLNKYDGNAFTILQQDPNSPDSSLRSNNISAIYEDRSGKLWVTTLSGILAGGGGLHQVDKRTGSVTPVVMKVPSDEWKQTLSIYEDRQGVLWIGSLAGLIGYNPQTGQCKFYPSPQKNVSILCSLDDTQNRFWVGLNGLYRFNRQSGQFTLVPLQSVRADRQPRISTLHQDKTGSLWAGTGNDGLLQITLTGDSAKLVPYAAKEPINRHLFSNAIHESRDGHLWIGTTEGLQQIDTRTGEVSTYRAGSGLVRPGLANLGRTNPVLSPGLSSDRVQAVYRDRAGTLWIGTDQGIDKQIGASALFATIQLVPAPASATPDENNISALLQDREGLIWIGSNNKTLYRYSPRRGQMTLIPIDSANPANPAEQHHVQTIYQDHTGQLWVSTVGALLRMDRVTGEFVRYPARINRIQSIDEDSSGRLWLGGKGGIARFNPKNGRFTYYSTDGRDFVEHVMVSRTGDVWMALNGNGIRRLRPTTGKVTRYHPDLPAPAGQLNDRQVTAFYEDTNGVVWIGTNTGGLNWYDPATGRFSALTTRDGLPANYVSAIINDRHGHLWISTSHGICRLNVKTKTVHTYTVEDGLPHNWFRRKVSRGLHGDLLFGSVNGVVIVHPDRIYTMAVFPVYITKLSVLNQNRPLTANPIRLRHDENFIAFDFVALSYRSSEKNQYAHQLVGVDKNWVYGGTRHFINYSTLSPGSYLFRVKAANSDGIWNEQGASITVIISPPWWATWWAYGFYALAFGGAVFGFVQFRIHQGRRQQAVELTRHKAEQLEAVDEMKTRFFANITHEFRTPLSLIIAPVEKLLQESRFDRPVLTTVQRNAEKLLRLINQLLDLSKLEGRYMAVSLMQGDVAEFVNHNVDVFRRAAEQKGVTLTCILADLPPQAHVFDADKWEKILTNLLSNALKFTPAGGQVTVTGRPILTVGGMSGIEIGVADSGIGMAPEKLPHIFDRFYQADTSSTRAYEGTGIGLALVHELIGLLGGTIAVESQLGVGTTFRLTLPVQSVSATADVPKISWPAPEQFAVASLVLPAPVPVASSSGEHYALPRIVIVEDNDELREFLVGELARSYQVLQAVDGKAGWAIIQAELPDIVLTDVMMPRMDGYELTRLIKSHADTDHIAVVMLTAKSAQQSRIDGLQQGADDYLSKPFSVAELHLRIHNLITRQQKLGEHYRRQFALPVGVDSLAEPTTSADSPDPFLNRVYDLLEKHLDDTSIGVDWLADQLTMNRKTLYRKVHSLIQLPPADLIRQYRLRKAADLLRAGHTVAETADLVGFNTSSHFSIVFKEFYLKTPTEFMGSRAKNG